MASITIATVGSDLIVSVSWSIANELLAAAKEQQLSKAELVGLLLLVTVVLSSTPHLWTSLASVSWLDGARSLLQWVKGRGAVPKPLNTAANSCTTNKKPSAVESVGFISFLAVFVHMAQRISLNVCVQLVASSVNAQQPLRAVRIVSLFGVAVFFLFLQSAMQFGRFKES